MKVRLTRSTKLVLGGAGLVVLVLAIGFATYLLGGRAPDARPKAARLEPRRTLASVPTRVLTLVWGDGSGSSVNRLVEYVFESEDHYFVVDFDLRQGSPRVRWFDEDGVLRGSSAAPIGATNFGPVAGGFAYVIGRGVSGTFERVAVHTLEPSHTVEFRVPLGLNSGGVRRIGTTLYAEIDNSTVDPRNNRATVEARLVPVAIAGSQASDAQAKAGALVAWGADPSGRLYGRRIEGTIGSEARPTQTITDIATSRQLDIPGSSQLIGVDGSGVVYTLIYETPTLTWQPNAGTPSTADPAQLVLIGDVSGGRQRLLTLTRSRVFQRSRAIIAVTKRGLLVTRVDNDGLHLVEYRGPADE